ncbi:MAG: hypothetical protein IPJ31_12975 [Bacteroidetes bacterium]|nr:hypothetical protein [Bacteroidota bacterium]
MSIDIPFALQTYNPLGTFTFAAPIVLESIVLGAKPTIQIDADNNGNLELFGKRRDRWTQEFGL